MEVKCEVSVEPVTVSDVSALTVAREHLSNGRCEKLIGEPDHRIRATAIVESNKLGPGER